MICRQCGTDTDDDPSGLCAGCQVLDCLPDALASKTKLGNTPFKDMKAIDEADRFKLIAGYLKANPGKRVMVMVDAGPGYEGKGDRYIRGIIAELPGTRLMSRSPGPATGETLIFKYVEE